MKLRLRPGDAARFGALLRTRIGVSLADSRLPDLERALQDAAEVAGLWDADALFELLGRRMHAGGPLDAVVSALNVNETHFFRDAGQMEALEQHILPGLIARRRRDRQLRVWSAGCSTGEEPYTLAMLLRRLVPDLSTWDILVLGTDVNSRALQHARRGVYREWSLRGMPTAARAAYLLPRGADVEVAPSIRDMVTFARLNLVEDAYPAPATNTVAMDLVLCRNVLLYFDDGSARAVVRRLQGALRDGGWLLVSQVEAGLGAIDGLEPAEVVTAAFRRVGPAEAAPADPADRAGPAAPAGWAAPAPGLRPPAAPGLRPAAAAGLRPAAAAVAERPGPGQLACGQALQLWRAGQPDPALALLERETDRNPLVAEVHFLYGLILLDDGRTRDALAAFRRCTYAEPGFVLGHLGLAGLFAREGQRDRARAALEHAAGLVAELDPDAPSLAGHGPRPAEIRELIAAHRQLLEPAPAAGGRDG